MAGQAQGNDWRKDFFKMNRGTLFNCICHMNKRQGTMHKAHLIWITFGCSQQAKREGGKEFGGSASKYLFGQKQVGAKTTIKQVEIGCDEVQVQKML